MTTRERRLTPAERRRRRRRRLTLALGYIVVAFGVSWYFESQATTTVVFIEYPPSPVRCDGRPSEYCTASTSCLDMCYFLTSGPGRRSALAHLWTRQTAAGGCEPPLGPVLLFLVLRLPARLQIPS